MPLRPPRRRDCRLRRYRGCGYRLPRVLPPSQVEPPPADPAHRCCSSFRESGRNGGKWLVGIPGSIDTLLSYLSSASSCFKPHHTHRIRNAQGKSLPQTHITLHEEYTAVLEEIICKSDCMQHVRQPAGGKNQTKNKKQLPVARKRLPGPLALCTCPCSRWGWRPAHPS